MHAWAGQEKHVHGPVKNESDAQVYPTCGNDYSTVKVRGLPLSSTVCGTGIASRGCREALLGSHGSRGARLSGSRG
eukprot:448602-Pyramimonas_sp.AAC.1